MVQDRRLSKVMKEKELPELVKGAVFEKQSVTVKNHVANAKLVTLCATPGGIRGARITKSTPIGMAMSRFTSTAAAEPS